MCLLEDTRIWFLALSTLSYSLCCGVLTRHFYFLCPCCLPPKTTSGFGSNTSCNSREDRTKWIAFIKSSADENNSLLQLWLCVFLLRLVRTLKEHHTQCCCLNGVNHFHNTVKPLETKNTECVYVGVYCVYCFFHVVPNIIPSVTIWRTGWNWTQSKLLIWLAGLNETERLTKSPNVKTKLSMIK